MTTDAADARTLDTELPSVLAAPTELRGLPLLDLVLHQIDLSPETWDQEQWHCGTSMCVAGWAATLAGGRWANDPGVNKHRGDAVTQSPYLVATEAERVVGLASYDGTLIHAEDRARELLGLDRETADQLFSPSNDRGDLAKIRTQLEWQARQQTLDL